MPLFKVGDIVNIKDEKGIILIIKRVVIPLVERQMYLMTNNLYFFEDQIELSELGRD